MLTYRFATKDENPAHLAAAAQEAIKDLPLYTKNIPSLDDLTKTVEFFLVSPDARLVLVEEDKKDIVGFIAFALIPDILFPKQGLIAMEMLLWVRKTHRSPGVYRRIVNMFENAAKDAGAAKTALACSEQEGAPKVGKLYERSGYRRMETTYIKELV